MQFPLQIWSELTPHLVLNVAPIFETNKVSLPPDSAPPVLFTVPPTSDSRYVPKLLSIKAADSSSDVSPFLKSLLSPGCSNSISATRLFRLPATRNTLQRRWGTPKYWASKIRHAISHSSERTIPAPVHLPLVGTSSLDSPSKAAKKHPKALSRVDKTPGTFSHSTTASGSP